MVTCRQAGGDRQAGRQVGRWQQQAGGGDRQAGRLAAATGRQASRLATATGMQAGGGDRQ